jgi:hypothetical protein
VLFYAPFLGAARAISAWASLGFDVKKCIKLTWRLTFAADFFVPPPEINLQVKFGQIRDGF